MRSRLCRLLSIAMLAVVWTACSPYLSAQQHPTLNTVPAFTLSSTAMHIRQAVKPNLPFTVTGSSGAILGLQNGNIELWDLPTKVFSNLQITAELDGYAVPIKLNSIAAAIDVEPDHTTITYSHAAITVRQHMFIPAGPQAKAGSGAIVFFEIESTRPATLTISMEPAMVQQWPAPQFGRPGVSWVPMGTGGGYVMSTDNPANFGFIAMPNAEPGVLFPYQERPESLPMQFKVRFDPRRDSGHYFPLLTELPARGESNSPAAVNAMMARLVAKSEALPQLYRETSDYYAHFFDHRLTVKTPNENLNKALRWDEIAIEQSKVKTGDETGLVAGWYPSFDSTRPGFGWYFGRDTLWSLYAVNSYGDRDLARQALEFISRRQRDDGKIMHEYSLTADSLDGVMKWSNFGYEYAAADATPLYIMAIYDYVRTTGDLAFLRDHWEQVKKAYAFDRAHDTDGVYDNSQGTGWVEAWPPVMPHQEIYLAALDGISSDHMSELAGLMNDTDLAGSARTTAAHIAASVAHYQLRDGRYAFSRGRDGAYDDTATVFPAVAMWTDARYLPQPDASLSGWANFRFATDWGVRAVAEGERVYDPISYHQGTVWPLFTGWAAMAEYRGNKPLAGYATLMRNVDLTWQQDPGFVTEVISGQFFQPLGRSSSHQLWSSAMTFSPAIRGLFGIEADALHHTLQLHPHLPAQWDEAQVENVRVGDDFYQVSLQRRGRKLIVVASSDKETVLCLNPDAQKPCSARPAQQHRIELPLPPVEIGFEDQGLPEPGSVTAQPRVISETYGSSQLSLTVEGLAGSNVDFFVRRNAEKLQIKTDGAERLSENALHIKLPQDSGVVNRQVTLRWQP
ncbi:MAG: glycogen debranching protein [Edaphobacter sp.]|uniref:amylo-alpha-1,6-glucosidase n=1 Tax=Edaphobacter sp. TaxID=1934404 RepID=UPI0023A6128F|nr:glycogen debranching protein [Edaphobacter sp.]MDE1177148.1 glycogen debranching protein [Edaphobacter sp.]